jgi:hypothetical protein
VMGMRGKCCMMRTDAAHEAAAMSKLVWVTMWLGEWMFG